MKFLWTTIYVKKMEESIAFYSKFAELKVLKRFPAGPGVEISFMGNSTDNETMVELLADSNNTEVSHSEFISIGFAVNSVESMMETVRSNQIPIYSGPVETPGSKFFSVKDPNGVIVQFFQEK